MASLPPIDNPPPDAPPVRPGPGRLIIATVIVWGVLYGILLAVLPASPRLFIRTEEPLEVVGTTGDSTAVVAVTMRAQVLDSQIFAYPTWPIRVYDLATGQERLLHQSPETAEPTEWLTDEFGDRYRTGTDRALGLDEHEFQISGDHIAAEQLAVGNDSQPERLRVLNWRTGETELEAPFDGEFRFFGDALLVNQWEDGGRLEIWNLRERRIIRGDWLRQFHRLEAASLSNDGRWLLPRSLSRVWDVAAGKPLLELPLGTETAAFSPDGNRLAFIGRWRETEDRGGIRRWQVLDLTGDIRTPLREEEERRDPAEPPQDSGGHRLTFLDDGTTLRSTWLEQVTTWTAEGFRYGEVPPGPPDRPLPKGDHFVYSPDDRWCVICRGRDPNRFNWLGLVPWDRNWSDDIHTYQLWELAQPRGVASLGRGSAEKCWFTPDSARVIVRSESGLSVFDVPPGYPWRKGASWSLLIPLLALAGSRLGRRRKPPVSKKAETSPAP